MEGEGDTYCNRKKCHISCPLCETTMQACSLATHYRAKHPTIPIPCPTDPAFSQDPRPATYLILEHDKHATILCPVTDCRVHVHGGWYAIHCHFYFCHHTLEVNVVEEGYLSGCNQCGFQCALPHEGHQHSQLCLKGQQRCLRHATTQDIIITWDFAPNFKSGDTTLDIVPSFKYLGC